MEDGGTSSQETCLTTTIIFADPVTDTCFAEITHFAFKQIKKKRMQWCFSQAQSITRPLAGQFSNSSSHVERLLGCWRIMRRDSSDPGIGPVLEGRLTPPLSLHYNNTSALTGISPSVTSCVRVFIGSLSAAGCSGATLVTEVSHLE